MTPEGSPAVPAFGLHLLVTGRFNDAEPTLAVACIPPAFAGRGVPH
jgi:hypothetical protein